MTIKQMWVTGGKGPLKYRGKWFLSYIHPLSPLLLAFIPFIRLHDLLYIRQDWGNSLKASVGYPAFGQESKRELPNMKQEWW
jgi:hypothetical protein